VLSIPVLLFLFYFPFVYFCFRRGVLAQRFTERITDLRFGLSPKFSVQMKVFCLVFSVSERLIQKLVTHRLHFFVVLGCNGLPSRYSKCERPLRFMNVSILCCTEIF